MQITDLFDQRPLPWALPEIPPLRVGNYGEWRLEKGKLPPLLRGYFRGLQPCPPDNWLLRNDRCLWMSITPAELESMAPMLATASGDVVVMGLGLGVLLHAVKRHPLVSSVTLIERDPKVLDLHRHTGVLDDVEVVLTDALTWRPRREYNVVMADIWPTFGDSAIEADTKRIARNVEADRYAIWTIELAYISWCAAENVDDPDEYGRFLDFAQDLNVRLAYHNLYDGSYERWCVRAAHNSMMR